MHALLLRHLLGSSLLDAELPPSEADAVTRFELVDDGDTCERFENAQIWRRWLVEPEHWSEDFLLTQLPDALTHTLRSGKETFPPDSGVSFEEPVMKAVFKDWKGALKERFGKPQKLEQRWVRYTGPNYTVSTKSSSEKADQLGLRRFLLTTVVRRT